MKKIKKVVALCLAVTVILASSGCTGNKTGNKANVNFKVTTDGNYPINTDKTLTYWVQLHESVAANFQSLNETAFGKELIAQTGIDIQFIHPPVTQVTERFNLMIASRDFPDIIEWGWYNFTGGPRAAIDNEVILPLNDIVEKVAPNFADYLDSRPELISSIITDEGDLYSFPMIRESDYLNTFFGPMFRKDLLDKAGLSVPETIDEWERALYAFRDMGIEVPLLMTLDNNRMQTASPFLGAFGVSGGFYVEDGKVKFGPVEREPFTAFVELMEKWYRDGILDKDFVDIDQSRFMTVGASGKWGVAFSSAGGSFGSWIPTITNANPRAEYIPTKYPVLTKGETPKFGQKNFDANPQGGSAAISNQCKDVELAARLLDYGYSDKGFLLYNFGIEGESFNMVNGIPTYTDIITDSSKNDGKPMSYTLAKYARGSYFGPFVQAENYMRQYAHLPEQQKALEVWADTRQKEYALPYVTLTAEENSEFSTIMADVNTYRQEALYKFITGVTSLDRLPEYFSTMDSMRVARAIEINQAAYDRYLNR